MSAWRNLYWSTRREVWENRYLYFVPAIVAVVAIAGFLAAGFHGEHGRRLRNLVTLEPAKQAAAASLAFSMAAALVLVSMWIAALFYALDALNAERRDRSILFWKSMPVSDLVTVASKTLVALVFAPLAAMAIVIVAQLAMFALSAIVLAIQGASPELLWSRVPFATMTLVMLYGVTIHALWFAPIYGWALLMSAWARRAAFLWAVVPFFALYVVEMLATGHSAIAALLRYRVMGAMAEGFVPNAVRAPILSLAQLDPEKFFANPNLWIGLAFAAACLAGAVRLRRYRDPT
ncbi:MAG: ABC transporter permease [Bacillota bacterium]